MSITYNWKIEVLQCNPTDGTNTNVVVQASWRCEGISSGHITSVYGTVNFEGAGDPFIPYENLTQEQVLQWCWDNGVNKIAIETHVAGELNKLINPPVIQKALPWVPSAPLPVPPTVT